MARERIMILWQKRLFRSYLETVHIQKETIDPRIS
jgi:hypothetical protein